MLTPDYNRQQCASLKFIVWLGLGEMKAFVEFSSLASGALLLPHSSNAVIISWILRYHMDATTRAIPTQPRSPRLGIIITQALLGLFLATIGVSEQWQTWTVLHKAAALSLLGILLVGPVRAIWRKRSGKEVDLGDLASAGYTAAWVAIMVFMRHSH